MYRDINDNDVRLPERDPNPPEVVPETVVRKVEVTISTTVTIRGTEEDVQATEKALNGQSEEFSHILTDALENEVWEYVDESEAHDFTVACSPVDLMAQPVKKSW